MNQIKSLVWLLLLVAAWSCEKEGDSFNTSSPIVPSSASKIASALSQQAATSSLTKEQALAIINYNYRDSFYPIKLEHVKGISRQQFTAWLQSTKLAPSKQYLLPLLSNPATEYVLLNVTLRATGKKATVGLVGVPNALSDQYDAAVTVVEKLGIETIAMKLCIWKDCSPKGKCRTWVKLIQASLSCPTNQCNKNHPCNTSELDTGTWAFARLHTAIAKF